METSDPTPDTVFTLSADATSLTVRTGSPRYIGTGGDIELRSGTRQQMHYNSESPMTVGVFTGPVCSTLTENGGAVEVRFTLDFNSAYAMTNTLKVSVKRKTGNKKRTERK